jgi:hypothetical protein
MRGRWLGVVRRGFGAQHITLTWLFWKHGFWDGGQTCLPLVWLLVLVSLTLHWVSIWCFWRNPGGSVIREGRMREECMGLICCLCTRAVSFSVSMPYMWVIRCVLLGLEHNSLVFHMVSSSAIYGKLGGCGSRGCVFNLSRLGPTHFEFPLYFWRGEVEPGGEMSKRELRAMRKVLYATPRVLYP